MRDSHFSESFINPNSLYVQCGLCVKMDIHEYLRQKEKVFASKAKNISNSRVFDFNYVPQKPLLREEVKPVIDAILRYKQTGIANHVLILGSRGSGKSVSAKFLMNILSDQTDLKFAYVNCRQHNTSFKILAELLHVKPRGTGLDELWQAFMMKNPTGVIFILDEIDLMSDKDKSKDILYLISRSSNNYMAILLSNNPKFVNCLDESIKSTLQPEMIHFSNYNANEIEAILKDRAMHGLGKVLIKELRYIAAHTCKFTNSDVRVAIKTLYLSALEPQVPLEEHFEKARRDIVVDVVKDLNDKNIQILWAIRKSHDGFVKNIYEKYRYISVRYNETCPFGRREKNNFLGNVGALERTLVVPRHPVDRR